MSDSTPYTITEYEDRVQELMREGMDRGDAQGIVDLEERGADRPQRDPDPE